MKQKIKTCGMILNLFIIFSFHTAGCRVSLPRLVSDGMVLQRDVHVNIWGWAAADEPVTIQFNGKTYGTTAGKGGRWSVQLSPLKAAVRTIWKFMPAILLL